LRSSVHGPLTKCSEKTRQGGHLQLNVKEERVWERGECVREPWHAEALELARIKFTHRSFIPMRARESIVMNDHRHSITSEAHVKLHAITTGRRSGEQCGERVFRVP
jgi:hypothetical protein